MPIITAEIDSAIDRLKQGHPVAIPTETVYGLAALIDNESAIKAVFAMKNRPLDHPLIVHVAKSWDLEKIVRDIPDYAQLLMQQFWPGPLTLVLKIKPNVINPLITGGQDTVAIRCPAHPLAQALLEKLNVPLVAPSANPFGKISPTTAEHVYKSFANHDVLILDGGRCTVGIESTIVDATHADTYQILRHGVIDHNRIAEVIETSARDKDNHIRVSGSLASHYQPQKPLYYFSSTTELEEFCTRNSNQVQVITLTDDAVKAAYELYYQLREADESETKFIAILLPPDTSAWQGVRDRIIKAGN